MSESAKRQRAKQQRPRKRSLTVERLESRVLLAGDLLHSPVGAEVAGGFVFWNSDASGSGANRAANRVDRGACPRPLGFDDPACAAEFVTGTRFLARLGREPVAKRRGGEDYAAHLRSSRL